MTKPPQPRPTRPAHDRRDPTISSSSAVNSEISKEYGLPLVAQVKPGNKSEMVARLMHYGFQPTSHAHIDNAYRWDPPS
jgi:hypothetical protein